MRKISALLLGLLLTGHTYAACDNDLDIKLAKTLKYSEALKRGDAYFSDCKISPADPEKTIVALSFIQPNQPADYGFGEGDYDLNVLVVETDTNKILSHFYQKSAFMSDAIRLDGIGIDTARYNLADGVRAFGVTSSYTGASRVNPYSTVKITLYVENGKQLKPVLQNLFINVNSGEWDGNCEGEFSETKRTISIGKTAASGYKNLLVNQINSGSRSVLENGECVAEYFAETRVIHLLKFDGQTYKLPKVLKANW